MEVLIFTDGGAFINRSEKSGYDSVAAYDIWINGKEVVCSAEFLRGKTNNFAEMYAIYKSLKIVSDYLAKKKHRDDNMTIKLVTDSELCKKSLTDWINGWLNNAHIGVLYNSKKEPVANQHLILMATIYLERLNHICNNQVYIQHINSHNSKNNLVKDCNKFNSKNNESLTVNDYEFYFMCNAKCDRMVKDKYDEVIR